MRRYSSMASRNSGLVKPTLAMLGVLAMLIGLGTWQLSRRTWKEELIGAIKERTSSEPIIFDAAMSLYAKEDLEYTPVRARGRYIPAKTMLYYAPDPKLGPGYHVYMPLETQAGEMVIVNRGFVPEREAGAVHSRMQGGPEAPTEIVGLLRKPGSKGLFTPANDPSHNLWYWRDLDGMAAHIRGEGGRSDSRIDNRAKIAPFFLETLANPGPIAAGIGRGGATRVELPNRHLEYALTWYGLAASLIGVYLIFVRNRWRRRRGYPGTGGATQRRNWGNS